MSAAHLSHSTIKLGLTGKRTVLFSERLHSFTRPSPLNIRFWERRTVPKAVRKNNNSTESLQIDAADLKKVRPNRSPFSSIEGFQGDEAELTLENARKILINAREFGNDPNPSIQGVQSTFVTVRRCNQRRNKDDRCQPPASSCTVTSRNSENRRHLSTLCNFTDTKMNQLNAGVPVKIYTKTSIVEYNGKYNKYFHSYRLSTDLPYKTIIAFHMDARYVHNDEKNKCYPDLHIPHHFCKSRDYQAVHRYQMHLDPKKWRKKRHPVLNGLNPVVRQYVCPYRRLFTCGRKLDGSERNTTDTTIKTQLSQKDRLKKAVKEYGTTVVVFHVGISLISLGGFYTMVSSGFDVINLLIKLGIPESSFESKIAAGASTFVVAYAVHKVFAPVRIAITLTSVPLIVRYLRRIGFLKTPEI